MAQGSIFFANVSSVLDSEKASMFCADGIGLVRTEIFYLSKDGPCSLEKRMETYRSVLRAFFRETRGVQTA